MHRISVDEIQRARPPGSPTTCETSSLIHSGVEAESGMPPNLHLRCLLGRKFVPFTMTSVFPSNGPRAPHTEDWDVLILVTVGIGSSYVKATFVWSYVTPSFVT